MISVILPIFNEEQNEGLWQSLAWLCQEPDLEIICVDSQSSDQTPARINSYKNLRYISIEQRSRAARINAGIKQARHSMILLHHPRSQLTPEGIERLREVSDRPIWGGFTHKFDWSHPILEFTSWYSNGLRPRFRKIVYLDHCIFFHRSLLPSPSYRFAEVDIFEDTVISEVLGQKAQPVILPAPSVTSSLRFRKNGVIRQCLLNAMMKAGYICGVEHSLMNRLYEKGLSLNTRYFK